MDTKNRTARFAHILTTALKQQHLRQVDLVLKAKEHGIKLGKSQVSQYLSGKTIPRRDVIAALEEILDIKFDDAKSSAADELCGSSRALEIRDSSSSSDAHKGTTPHKATARAASNEPFPARKFKKSSKLENVLYDVRGPVVDEAARMEANGEHVLKLNIGNPAPFGFRAPDEVVLDMRQQLTYCEGYSASRGLFSCRKAIMQYDQLRNIPNVTMDDIYTGNGAVSYTHLTLPTICSV